MPRKAEPYTPHSDKNRNEKAFWRVYVYDPKTQKRKKFSTGIEDDGTKRSKAKADRMALEWLENGFPNARKESALTFAKFSEDFWSWEHSEYLAARLVRDSEALSPEYVKNMELCLRVHALPLLGHLALLDITPDVLDDMVTRLLKKKQAPSTVKHVLHSVSPIFQWAIRKRLIQYDPVPSMLPFTVRAVRPGDALDLDEARALLDLGVSRGSGSPGRPSPRQARRPIFTPTTHLG